MDDKIQSKARTIHSVKTTKLRENSLLFSVKKKKKKKKGAHKRPTVR